MPSVSALSAMLNGAFWAAATSIWWLGLTSPKHDVEQKKLRQGFGVIATVAAVLGGVVLHWMVAAEPRIPGSSAIAYWAISFTAASALILLAVHASTPNRERPIRPLEAYFEGVAVCLICGLALGVSYDWFAKRTPADRAEAKSAASAPSPSSDGYSDVAVKSAAMVAVKERLADPGSARFKDVFVLTQSNGAKAVCGQVNGKNHLGARSGFQHFVSAGVAGLTLLEEEASDFREAWNKLCVSQPKPSATQHPSRLIDVPSDAGASYELVSLRNAGPTHVIIVTHRSGPSGESYSRRMVNCSNLSSKYTGDGNSLSEMEASSGRIEMASWEAGPISKDISRYACHHRK